MQSQRRQRGIPRHKLETTLKGYQVLPKTMKFRTVSDEFLMREGRSRSRLETFVSQRLLLRRVKRTTSATRLSTITTRPALERRVFG